MKDNVLYGSLTGKSALIAEENDEFRTFLVNSLKELGVETRVAEHGREAWELIQKNGYQLAILNVYLDKLLGVEIVDRIRSVPTIKSMKIILVGAIRRAYRYHSAPKDLYGADAYVENLITRKEFYGLLRKIFLLTKPRDEGKNGSAAEDSETVEARKKARLILSDIISANLDRARRGILRGNFYELLGDEIKEGKEKFDGLVPAKVRKKDDYFFSTINDFLKAKRLELAERSEEIS